jgi:carbonic anhydrase/acetyltransferase-like protein (isoleucine patch superfamily)
VATLIGNGGHAHDIIHSTPGIEKQFAHHSAWDGSLPVIIGISDPRKRADVAAFMDVHDLAWVHPHTYINRSSWRDGAHINYSVSMTRATIGRHTTIAPGVTICGDVVIGDRVLIGAGATLCEKVLVEDDAVIGAGAVVTPGHWGPDGEVVYNRVPAGETWVGVPARPL